jgi:hypothetical protein
MDKKNSYYKFEGATEASIQLDEFQITWDYDANGKILLSLNDKDGRMIQSIEHVKSKI